MLDNLVEATYLVPVYNGLGCLDSFNLVRCMDYGIAFQKYAGTSLYNWLAIKNPCILFV